MLRYRPSPQRRAASGPVAPSRAPLESPELTWAAALFALGGVWGPVRAERSSRSQLIVAFHSSGRGPQSNLKLQLEEPMQIALRPSPRQLSLGRARTAGRLGAEEERALLARAKSGDRAARDELVERMLPVVVAVARRYRRAGALIDDLIQEGVLGLYQAVSHFEPSRSNRFVTYAIWWVRAYVKRHFDVHRSQVRGGANRTDVSLDAPFGDEQELTGLERLADLEPSAELALLEAERAQELRGSLQQAKARIGDIGWDVLHARTMSPEPETLDGLGERHGVSRESIRIQEKRTLAFLKRYLAEWEAP